MRSPVERRRTFRGRLVVALAAAAALGACGTLGGAGSRQVPYAQVVPGNGPQADYPVVVGEPYTIAEVGFTPEDVLNYDQVGYMALDSGGAGVSAAHHTLPLPSYVEATSLETGRTILVRVERRGPMTGTELLALSPDALAQLGSSAGAPVRVRRVNPPEDQRALLRAGQPAPVRIDTPTALVEVLKRKLPGQGASVRPATSSGAAVASVQPVAVPPSAALPAPLSTAAAETPVTPSSTEAPRTEVATQAGHGPAGGRFVVQAAAFSSSANANRVAAALGGVVTQAGRFFRVRTGPFTTRGEAEASLAKVRASGYNDARIQISG